MPWAEHGTRHVIFPWCTCNQKWKLDRWHLTPECCWTACEERERDLGKPALNWQMKIWDFKRNWTKTIINFFLVCFRFVFDYDIWANVLKWKLWVPLLIGLQTRWIQSWIYIINKNLFIATRGKKLSNIWEYSNSIQTEKKQRFLNSYIVENHIQINVLVFVLQ